MKYIFEVVYNKPHLKEISNFLKNRDLNIEDCGVREKFSLTSNKDLPISKIKEYLAEALRMCDYEILHIEGGKIE